VLLAARSGSHSYFFELQEMSRDVRQSLRFEASHVAFHTIVFPMFGRRVFEADRLIRLSAALWAAAGAVVAGWCWRARAVRRRAALWFVGAYLIGAATFLVSRTPSAAHHFVFLHLPILALLMVAGAANARAFACVVTFVVVSNLGSIALLTASPVTAAAARERSRIFEHLQRSDVAAQYVLNFSSWGGYYQQSLYGDRDQIVTYVEPLTGSDAGKLMDIARLTSRDIINVCLGCNYGSVAAVFDRADVSVVDLGLTAWQVFRIDVPPRVAVEHRLQ